MFSRNWPLRCTLLREAGALMMWVALALALHGTPAAALTTQTRKLWDARTTLDERDHASSVSTSEVEIDGQATTRTHTPYVTNQHTKSHQAAEKLHKHQKSTAKIREPRLSGSKSAIDTSGAFPSLVERKGMQDSPDATAQGSGDAGAVVATNATTTTMIPDYCANVPGMVDKAKCRWDWLAPGLKALIFLTIIFVLFEKPLVIVGIITVFSGLFHSFPFSPSCLRFLHGLVQLHNSD